MMFFFRSLFFSTEGFVSIVTYLSFCVKVSVYRVSFFSDGSYFQGTHAHTTTLLVSYFPPYDAHLIEYDIHSFFIRINLYSV